MVICGDHSASSLRLAGLQRGDRLLQHLLVELVADLLDVAGLLLAEEVAGAADVEVVARELEAGAERVERLEHLEPALGIAGEDAFGRHGEQRIGALLRAADAAAELVELGEAEHVGAMDDEGVRGRDVEAGFDDRGREEDIVGAVVEGVHDVLELGRRHLAMRHRDLHLRHCLGKEGALLGEVGDPRADVEALAAAVALAQQRLAHHQAVERGDEGADRQPVDRRRGDQRQLADAGQRQLQRARDRRRRQRQHMDVGLQLLEPLLVLDAEMLLLVDDEEREVAELDRLRRAARGCR